MLPVCPGYSLQKHSLPCSSLKKWGRKHPNKNQISSVHDTFTCEENSILGLFRTVNPPPPQLLCLLGFRQILPSFSGLPGRHYREEARLDKPAFVGHLGTDISGSPAAVARECFIKYIPWDDSFFFLPSCGMWSSLIPLHWARC